MSTPGTFHKRAEWGARPPRSMSALLNAQGNRLHYNGGAMTSLVADHSRCAPAVRGIQRFHMDSRGWADIAYTDLVCPHGHVYEGRGVGVRTAAHGTTACNNRYYATMALIGGSQPVYPALRVGLNASIDRLRASGAGDHVGGHSDCKATACPGDPMRAWIRAGRPSSDVPAPQPSPPSKGDDDVIYEWLTPENKYTRERFIGTIKKGEVVLYTDHAFADVRVATGVFADFIVHSDPPQHKVGNELAVRVPHGKHVRIELRSLSGGPVHGVTVKLLGDHPCGVTVYQ